MATSGLRFTLGMTFSSQEEKDTFKAKIDAARRILFPEDSASKRPDNTALLNAMLDLVVSIPPTVPSTLQPSWKQLVSIIYYMDA